MTDFKIDKGIKVPSRGTRWEYLFPLEKMGDGDSFYAGPEYEKKLRYACTRFNKKHSGKKKAIVRRDRDGFRAWVVFEGDA